jgi:hypothetical protein
MGFTAISFRWRWQFRDGGEGRATPLPQFVPVAIDSEGDTGRIELVEGP